ncbi:SH3 domain-containing protein 1 [Elsinoe fawcettii]|nr:SH3 domain-containing protein 1 [Elsinoe fawcettii]
MADVLQPQQASASADSSQSDENAPPPLSLDPVKRQSTLPHRLSSYSQSRSRHTSTVFPLFHSSLQYALVRDFAYPPYNPMHYGPVPDRHSIYSSTDGDYDSRRVSDPPPWDASAGPWRDSSFDKTGQQLPSTSFGLGDDSDDDGTGNRRSSRRISKHRKSKSYADMEAYTRGRRRTSRERKSTQRGTGGQGQHSANSSAYVGYFAEPFDRNDSAYSNQFARQSRDNRGPGYEISINADGVHPPFREDGESVPYSPSALEDHRPESASLDESFAGPSLALYDFNPENDNELELREGQIIQVGYRHGQGWLVAMNLETGEQGLVPEEYVRLLRDIEGWGEGPPEHERGMGHDEIDDDGEDTETDEPSDGKHDEDNANRQGSLGSTGSARSDRTEKAV